MKGLFRKAVGKPIREQEMRDLADKVCNSTLEAAAKVAKLYGAPDEAVRRILMLKGSGRAALTKESASTRSGTER